MPLKAVHIHAQQHGHAQACPKAHAARVEEE